MPEAILKISKVDIAVGQRIRRNFERIDFVCRDSFEDFVRKQRQNGLTAGLPKCESYADASIRPLEIPTIEGR